MRWIGWMLVLSACGEALPEAAMVDDCDEGPVVTWANFGQGFLVENCQACHATTSPNRQGAPDTVVFDTEEDAWAWSERILARAGGDPATMPPQGGTTADDRTRLELWLTCGG